MADRDQTQKELQATLDAQRRAARRQSSNPVQQVLITSQPIDTTLSGQPIDVVVTSQPIDVAVTGQPVDVAITGQPISTNATIQGQPISIEAEMGSNLDLAKTAFGELSVAEPTPKVQLLFPYNINAAQVISFPGNGGSVSNGNDHANVSSGTAADGFAFILSRDVVKYGPGQGALIKFSALFTTGVANSEQLHGAGANLDGFFFGYDGADFGVLRRTSGMPEIRVLTITTPSTTDENITITLDGDSDATVAVTNSGDVDVTAREIAAHNFASLGTGWGALAAGDKVTFVSVDAAAHAGSYSLSGTTVVGSFAQTAAGTDATDTWVAQANWNMDAMDGNGPSGMTLDPTKGNIYEIRYGWFGYSPIVFFIRDSVTGFRQPVHRIEYGNANTSPSVSNPTFGLFMSVRNLGNTSDLTVKSSSMSGFVEGKESGLGVNESADNFFQIGNVTTEEPILTIRNKQVYQSQINRVRIKPTLLSLTSALSDLKAFTVFRIYVQATPENGTSYEDVNVDSSVVEFDISAVDFDISEVTRKTTFILSATASEIINLVDLGGKIAPGNTLLITAQPSKGNASNEVGASLNWLEEF